ncbi:hypothetical protein Nepgr_026793 [Nepenthes gracilis]|uniref:VQ domain-containing protein n=1 Tax=Nepenthes gracilis TaxID=150966 RepID=A0AAD3T7H2_NEPGR|nr:hypothetical protein Nepgr_026793 [Nepenthes gracilis]
MEITSRLQERENPSPINSPGTNGINRFTTGAAAAVNGGGQFQTHIPTVRSEPISPYQTTFVTADTSSFKQVVQMLTGSSETSKNLSKQANDHLPTPPSKNFVIPPIKSAPKKQGFKLYERRNILRNNLMISPSTANFSPSSAFSPRKPEISSPSLLDFPSLTLSPVTPLAEDPFDKSSPSVGNSSQEERAIAEKGFYFHPSPISSARESVPPLLPLFPVTSPRVSDLNF